ncbi:MAG: SPOR domain-containing protein [Chitinophagaceae bacterium]
MKQMLSFILLAAFFSSAAQDSSQRLDTGYGMNMVIVHKDPRVDVLIKKQGAINTATKKAMFRTARGFRLLVINTNKREDAIAAKTRIYTLFPELKSYLSYQSPYFKLKAGNFKTRDEALRYQKTMNSLFPKGVFIINDIVEVKPEKEEFTEL